VGVGSEGVTVRGECGCGWGVGSECVRWESGSAAVGRQAGVPAAAATRLAASKGALAVSVPISSAPAPAPAPLRHPVSSLSGTPQASPFQVPQHSPSVCTLRLSEYRGICGTGSGCAGTGALAALGPTGAALGSQGAALGCIRSQGKKYLGLLTLPWPICLYTDRNLPGPRLPLPRQRAGTAPLLLPAAAPDAVTPSPVPSPCAANPHPAPGVLQYGG